MVNPADRDGGKHATIRDIAQRARVSVATVSRVLNNSSAVRPFTRERVIEAIRELDFHPNGIARSLSTRRTYSVALITSDISNPTYPVIARALSDALHADGYTVALYNTDDDIEKIETIVTALRRQRVDGAVIVQHLPIGNQIFRRLASKGMPLVSLGPETGDVPGIDVVQGDVEAGTGAATEDLIRLGHRRIAYVGAPAPVQAVTTGYDQALAGLRRALAQHGLPFDPGLVIPGDTRRDSGATALRLLMEHSSPPTAVLAANDLVALGVVAEASRLGLRVPRDLSVVGCDGIPILDLLQPRLATVAQPLREMAEVAARLLLRRMSGERFSSQIVTLPCQVIMDGSVGLAPGSGIIQPSA